MAIGRCTSAFSVVTLNGNAPSPLSSRAEPRDLWSLYEDAFTITVTGIACEITVPCVPVTTTV
jgi:hypothetical protein